MYTQRILDFFRLLYLGETPEGIKDPETVDPATLEFVTRRIVGQLTRAHPLTAALPDHLQEVAGRIVHTVAFCRFESWLKPFSVLPFSGQHALLRDRIHLQAECTSAHLTFAFAHRLPNLEDLDAQVPLENSVNKTCLRIIRGQTRRFPGLFDEDMEGELANELHRVSINHISARSFDPALYPIPAHTRGTAPHLVIRSAVKRIRRRKTEGCALAADDFPAPVLADEPAIVSAVPSPENTPATLSYLSARLPHFCNEWREQQAEARDNMQAAGSLSLRDTARRETCIWAEATKKLACAKERRDKLVSVLAASAGCDRQEIADAQHTTRGAIDQRVHVFEREVRLLEENEFDQLCAKFPKLRLAKTRGLANPQANSPAL